jgi:hypothetical protein
MVKFGFLWFNLKNETDKRVIVLLDTYKYFNCVKFPIESGKLVKLFRVNINKLC